MYVFQFLWNFLLRNINIRFSCISNCFLFSSITRKTYMNFSKYSYVYFLHDPSTILKVCHAHTINKYFLFLFRNLLKPLPLQFTFASDALNLLIHGLCTILMYCLLFCSSPACYRCFNSHDDALLAYCLCVTRCFLTHSVPYHYFLTLLLLY